MATLQSTNVAGTLTSTGYEERGGGEQGFQGYYAWWQNNIAYTVDFAVRQISGGSTYWCSACYNHSGNAYGAGNESFITRYDSTGESQLTLHNYSTGQGGSIGWTGPNVSTLRVTKNAGYYPGQGGAIVQVKGPI